MFLQSCNCKILLNLSIFKQLSTYYNFNDFLEKDNNSKKIYKNKNINLEKYFNKSDFSNLKNKEKNNNLFEYRFIFPEDFQGDIFFKNYIVFTQKKTMLEFETEIKETVNSTINYELQVLEYIKKLNITTLTDFKLNNILNENFAYQNFNSLTQQIEKNKMLGQNVTYKKFDHNPFFDEPSKPTPASNYFVLLYSLSGLLIGFLLSLIIIYYKNPKIKL
jgi:hypothetical protein